MNLFIFLVANRLEWTIAFASVLGMVGVFGCGFSYETGLYLRLEVCRLIWLWSVGQTMNGRALKHSRVSFQFQWMKSNAELFARLIAKK
jgi:hypothetical protein